MKYPRLKNLVQSALHVGHLVPVERWFDAVAAAANEGVSMREKRENRAAFSYVLRDIESVEGDGHVRAVGEIAWPEMIERLPQVGVPTKGPVLLRPTNGEIAALLLREAAYDDGYAPPPSVLSRLVLMRSLRKGKVDLVSAFCDLAVEVAAALIKERSGEEAADFVARKFSLMPTGGAHLLGDREAEMSFYLTDPEAVEFCQKVGAPTEGKVTYRLTCKHAWLDLQKAVAGQDEIGEAEEALRDLAESIPMKPAVSPDPPPAYAPSPRAMAAGNRAARRAEKAKARRAG